ncbi:ubiquinol oxidase subunit II [Ketobacter sp. MCCC 1A13808]|uniref:ubiquinol oxidase subunit II n=1 Tax=Ketobacter sp. MCCC 1A13808 TaxID=2602738 RepID=UPI0012ECBA6B|nr:ubiquinol oxidase subunit II [Ketobacter sp. MCCC 1A13808]
MLTRNFKNVAVATVFGVLSGCSGGVLDPKGQVGADEKYLIILSTVLMLLVVIPVILLTLYFAWKYRDGREHEVYMPKWSHSKKIEIVVWFIPILIIAILATITWQSTQALDPYKKLTHEKDHLTIEVVSLNWKWLFIYPDQGIASVNEVVFPTGVPVEFKITSDTTMNSFFIPQLGSQIYSMAGMTTKLHLIADEPGSFEGISANYSGAGFTGMKFKAIATPAQSGFDQWVKQRKACDQVLTPASYQALAEPSKNNVVQYYSQVSEGLFQQVVMKYMHDNPDTAHPHSMDHLAQAQPRVEESL